MLPAPLDRLMSVCDRLISLNEPRAALAACRAQCSRELPSQSAAGGAHLRARYSFSPSDAQRGAAGLGLHTVSLRIGISPERFSFHLANSTHPIPKGFSAWA